MRLRLIACLLTASLAAACAPPAAVDDIALLDLDAPTLAEEIRAGRVSAERVARAAIARIAVIDRGGPTLNSMLEINPDAIEIARELDRRFLSGGAVGPLHGLPVVLKANIDTGDAMATSAGSLALAEHRATADAELVERLREAGAVILGKTNLSEWANFRSTGSTSGWSSLGGQTKNPYVLDRNPCGSSSGSAVAVAARLVPLAVGTETDGSIVCPAGANGVVGIKPTLGLVSQRGIVPLAASQDTAGPMARTVAGAAMLLAAMQSVAAEPQTYAGRADLDTLRLGVVRDYVGAGADAQIDAAFASWIDTLRAAGAELVDPVLVELADDVRAAELEVLLYEFKDGVDRYLADVRAGPTSLDALIVFNEQHAEEVMPFFGQELLLMAEARGALDEPAYAEAVAASRNAVRARLEALFAEHELDALVAPVNAPAWKTDHERGDDFFLSSSSLAAVSGYPSVAVPAGLIGELPVAIAFVGAPGSEADLVRIAAAYEHVRGTFPAPRFLESVD